MVRKSGGWTAFAFLLPLLEFDVEFDVVAKVAAALAASVFTFTTLFVTLTTRLDWIGVSCALLLPQKSSVNKTTQNDVVVDFLIVLVIVCVNRSTRGLRRD